MPLKAVSDGPTKIYHIIYCFEIVCISQVIGIYIFGKLESIKKLGTIAFVDLHCRNSGIWFHVQFSCRN